jgi:hypothetical protein
MRDCECLRRCIVMALTSELDLVMLCSSNLKVFASTLSTFVLSHIVPDNMIALNKDQRALEAVETSELRVSFLFVFWTVCSHCVTSPN